MTETLEQFFSEPLPKFDLEKSKGDLQCPYCLFSSSFFNVFIVLGKNASISKRMAKCPRCNNSLRRKTLVLCGQVWDIREYARWVCDIREYDVNAHLKWTAIKAWIYKKGKTKEFWDYYYERKKEIHPEYVRSNSYTHKEEAN